MQQVNYSRILSWLAFLALAAFSCKWTAESLYLWQPTLGLWGGWVLAILSFVVSSLCFSKLLSSLDQNQDFYGKLGGRFGAFIIGILGLCFFWLCISLPTNTHTLIYNSEVKTVLTNDLTRTNKYLSSITNSNSAVAQINAKYDDFSTSIAVLLSKLSDEYTHPERPGLATRCEAIINQIEAKFGTILTSGEDSRIIRADRHSNKSMSYVIEQVKRKLAIIDKNRENEIARVMNSIQPDVIEAAQLNIVTVINDINDMRGIDFDILENAEKALEDGYGLIANNAKYITFDSDEDKARYTADKPVTEYSNLKNVWEVVVNGISSGKYKGLYYWILIALLVDIAGFIFFNIAVSKKNNSI